MADSNIQTYDITKEIVKNMQQKSSRVVTALLIMTVASLFLAAAVLLQQGKMQQEVVTIAPKGQIVAAKSAPIVLPFSSDALHAKIHIEDLSNDVILRIFNFNSSEIFTVLAEVPNMYNIAAHQMVSAETARSLEFRLSLPSEVPTNTSAFQVYVYRTKIDARGYAMASSDLVKPSPFFVAVPKKEPASFPDAKSRRSRLPACQSLPNLFPLEGIWHGPESITSSDKENVRMRTGWNFEPARCNLEAFSQEELNATAKPITIAVLGSSIERGIFLSLIDMVTSRFEKTELADSRIRKCWGRAEVSVGNIKLVYQDMRANLMTTNGEIKCHGNQLAVGTGFFQNGTAMIRKLLFDHNPDVIVSISGCSVRTILSQGPHPCFSVMKQLISDGTTTSDWDGIWVLLDYMFTAHKSISNQEQRLAHLSNLDRFSKTINDERVRLVDTTSISSPMVLYSESGGQIQGSQHFHRICNGPGDNLRVCSNVTEAVAQLVLGMAIAPEGKLVAKASNTQDSSQISSLTQQRIVQSCFDCPASIVPFHILPAPNLTCEQGIRAAQKAGDPYVSIACPTYCMMTAPTGEVQTQSGKVVERKCMLQPSSSFSNQTRRSTP